MRKSISFISVICLLLMAAMPLSAQDARQRKTETIVQDVLALMPLQTQQDYNREMTSLAQSAPQSVEILAAMLQPAEKHANNLVEYAISGTVTQTDQPHGWVEIDFDGKTYIFDCEWEMAYRVKQNRYDMDMFMIDRQSAKYWNYKWK